MTQTEPLMIAVAPNGARKSQRDHPRLPINPQELADTAATCLDAGACMLHLHVRDSNGGHSLDAGRYHDATAAIRHRVGDELIIQITTESVGLYTREQQMAVVVATRPEAVSLAIREISPAGCDERSSAEFFTFLRRERINAQYILYDEADVSRFQDLQARGIVSHENFSVLLVLGRYAENQQSDPTEIAPLISGFASPPPWFLCAFGASEAACMSEAMRLGGHCRVGFENNLLMPDGRPASDNAELVRSTSASARSLGRRIATADEARQLLGMRG